ncbi:phosphatase PAP2 family protein [Shewanella sp. UCD-KL12]|uniref:phosphatase PAP2 family protein n=1 Tax=Shewanella sp. UCD-KL12 TaxID=1917163 RepID=UPI000970B376|nr:phosphatase PAP2 family protein [Shewanella sp. UCD-KL12]
MSVNHQNFIEATSAKELQNFFYSTIFILFFLHLLTLNQASNYEIFNSINAMSSLIPQWLQAVVNDFGNGITLGAIIVCYLVKRPEMMCRVLFAAVLSLICVPLLKQYFDAPRPPQVLEYLNIVGEARYKHSFPSGHTATAFLFAGLISMFDLRAKVKVTLLILAACVGGSRILIGAHWPADVVMGAIIGLSCAYVATKFCPLITLTFRKKLLAYLLLISALIISEMKSGYDFPTIPLVQYVRWGLLLFSVIAVVIFIYREFSAGIDEKFVSIGMKLNKSNQ